MCHLEWNGNGDREVHVGFRNHPLGRIVLTIDPKVFLSAEHLGWPARREHCNSSAAYREIGAHERTHRRCPVNRDFIYFGCDMFDCLELMQERHRIISRRVLGSKIVSVVQSDEKKQD